MYAPAHHHCLIQQDACDTWLSFEQPRAILATHRLDEVAPILAQVMEWVDKHGYWAAGFISYEAAPAFDSSLLTHPPGVAPLIWFGIYAQLRTISGIDLGSPSSAHDSIRWQASLAREDHAQRIARLRAYIGAGDNYQTNFTMRMSAAFAADPWNMFLRMVDPEMSFLATRCAAYVDAGDCVVASASPELLLHLEGDAIRSRPMKGTASRGRWPAEDRARSELLLDSSKDRAENLMIVDMVRNDLSRIARLGSVRTPALFDLERYPALWTLTSTVEAKTDATIVEILRALFPAASITGAPKRRTMQIIHEVETQAREIYTGSVGYIGPGRRAQFNVAIRTALIDRKRKQVEYGVGGGVVWDSTSDDEYDECLLKARVVTQARAEFDLLETLLWRPSSGYVLLSRHLARLRESADYFGYAFDASVVLAQLNHCVALCPAAQRVRLRLTLKGEVHCEVSDITADDASWPLMPLLDHVVGEAGVAGSPLKLALANSPIDEREVFLFHKTTRRQVYEQALREASMRVPDCTDVLLYNRRSEATESTIANLVVEIDGRLLTPPIASGLLAGTLRAELLERGVVSEARIRVEALRGRATRLWLVNSVRGWRRVVLA
jgi:para-aminobenzoate synthetase/4-amino-4-deoxychorismate lyase